MYGQVKSLLFFKKNFGSSDAATSSQSNRCSSWRLDMVHPLRMNHILLSCLKSYESDALSRCLAWLW